MFDKYTEKAEKVISLAQEEARRLGHNFVGTEQILLGLISEGTGAAARVLKTRGVTLKDARAQVEKIIGRGSGFVSVDVPYTPRAQKILQIACVESEKLHLGCIATEHLLLGILISGEGVAIPTLEALGVDLDELKTDLIKVAGERSGARLLDHHNINLIDSCEELILFAEKLTRMNERVRSGIKDLCERQDLSRTEKEKIQVELQECLSRVEITLGHLGKTPSSFSAEKKLVSAWSKK